MNYNEDLNVRSFTYGNTDSYNYSTLCELTNVHARYSEAEGMFVRYTEAYVLPLVKKSVGRAVAV